MLIYGWFRVGLGSVLRAGFWAGLRVRFRADLGLV